MLFKRLQIYLCYQRRINLPLVGSTNRCFRLQYWTCDPTGSAPSPTFWLSVRFLLLLNSTFSIFWGVMWTTCIRSRSLSATSVFWSTLRQSANLRANFSTISPEIRPTRYISAHALRWWTERRASFPVEIRTPLMKFTTVILYRCACFPFTCAL